MSKFKQFFNSVFKWVIAALALGNLVFLFVFDYQLPDFIKSRLPDKVVTAVNVETVSDKAAAVAASVAQSETQRQEEDSLQIQFPEEDLFYDGNGSLDLIAGVSVVTASGEEYSNMGLFTTIKSSKMPNEKIVEYSITDDNGRQVTAERTLKLDSAYNGPSIDITDAPTSVSQSDLARITDLWNEEGILHADDGFGRDISSAVTAEVSAIADTTEYRISLSVVNMLNDTCTQNIVVNVADAGSEPTSGPVLKLTQSSVVLQVGDSFEFLEYIASAEDDDGTQLYQSISVNGSVDTSTPGTYDLDMYCTNYRGETSPIVTLTVYVE